MSMNSFGDLYSTYINEVLKPQLGKDSPTPTANTNNTPESSSKPGEDAAGKRIRQAVYDIRYRARREDIPLAQAYTQYMTNTSMNAVEKNAVREKLGLTPGGGASVKEEVSQKKYQVRVTPVKGFGSPTVRYVSNAKIQKLRKNPQISSVEKTKYGTPYEGEKTSGKQTRDALQHKPNQKKAEKDYDGDGKLETSTQEWKGSRDKAIKKSMGMKEGFSNWRNDLSEVVGDDILNKKQQQVKEKKVDNQIEISPKLSENIEILESFELTEEYLENMIDICSEYFYNEGYNYKNIEQIIEEIGYDEFLDLVFDIGSTLLSEASVHQGELLTKSGKPRKNPDAKSKVKGASSEVQHKPSPKNTEKEKDNKSSPGQLSIDYNKKPTPPGQERIKRAVGDAVKKATSPEAKKAVGSAVKGTADTVARAALSAWQGHKAAMEKRRGGGTVAQQIGAGAGKALGSFFKKGKEHLKAHYEFGNWINEIINEGIDISEFTISELYEEYEDLIEKAVSQNQQQLAGMALKYLDGDMPDASDEVKQMAKMGRTELRKFAKTKHKGLPEVKEAIVDTGSTASGVQQRTAQTQQANARNKIEGLRKRLERERIKSMRDGTYSTEETKKPSALDFVRQQVIAKHGAASVVGTPENEAARKKAAAKAKKQPKPSSKERYTGDVYSKDGLGGIRGYRSGD